MKRKLLAGALSAFTVLVLFAGPHLGLRSDGIQFPDGSVQTTAAGDGRIPAYVTLSKHQGSTVRSACADGFHAASLWEIFDPSNLRYASGVPGALNAITVDQGSGPPVTEAWVRTGALSSTGLALPGVANCDVWSSSLAEDEGTVVELKRVWDQAADLGAWDAVTLKCHNQRPVWCIAD